MTKCSILTVSFNEELKDYSALRLLLFLMSVSFNEELKVVWSISHINEGVCIL